ncbi:GIY-YIG nuclease family protein [Streptomyces afghaniensis]|uniref:GIY-YIG nuclease family protein n=1 Tax=Streptomyces afghaniensis TaxID=66865 RepID=UPI003788440E
MHVITHDTGFVYVMRNPAMPDMVKIGLTTLLPEERAAKISSHEGVPLPFEVVFRALTMRWPKVEKLVHQRLGKKRVNPRREYFSVSADIAVETVRECVLEVNGNDAWEVGEIHPIGGEDRIALSLEAGEVFVLLAQPSLFGGGGWEPLDLWQAHADGDQLEIYSADGPDEVAGFSDGDVGGDDDPVPHLDAAGNVANGVLIGRERLAPGDRILWMRDAEKPGACRGVLFEAREYCQIACRTWNPRVTSHGMPLILNHLERDPSPAMVNVSQLALRLPGPRTWAPRPTTREELALPLPGPERWLPQLRPKKDRPPRRGKRSA